MWLNIGSYANYIWLVFFVVVIVLGCYAFISLRQLRRLTKSYLQKFSLEDYEEET